VNPPPEGVDRSFSVEARPTVRDDIAASITRAHADLEQALANLDQLPAIDQSNLALAAHALNNYLTVSSGAVELLLRTLAAHPDPQVQTWLHGLQHVNNLMAHTVATIMNVSALEEPPLRFEPMDLATLVQRACWYYRRRAAQKGIDLTVETSPEATQVWSDRVAVAAVLDNLLSNAVKFSDPGKRIAVRVYPEPGHLVCSVQDEGPGISPRDQALLFQEGVRLGSAPTGGEPSSGYGLAVARRLVEKLHGTIWCESAPGRGARFSFKLPVSAPVEDRPLPSSGSPGHPAEPG
jgi:signal transduction histidine kinase